MATCWSLEPGPLHSNACCKQLVALSWHVSGSQRQHPGIDCARMMEPWLRNKATGAGLEPWRADKLTGRSHHQGSMESSQFPNCLQAMCLARQDHRWVDLKMCTVLYFHHPLCCVRISLFASTCSCNLSDGEVDRLVAFIWG